MAGLAIRWVLNALALWAVSVIVPGIHAENVLATFAAALVLGILNALLRPILLLLTLPINLLTLGLFTFVVNALMLELTAAIVRGFAVDGFGSALIGALVLSVVSFALNVLVSDAGGIRSVHIEYRRF
jgi:putative membrane protein